MEIETEMLIIAQLLFEKQHPPFTFNNILNEPQLSTTCDSAVLI